mmetsp:Transcript_37253/g.97665  ORF Transcript_37253/g.97665 Transcript_37253/m.97665 type:complete len:378 (-) Transcript_37253:310-1443(-)
MASSMLHCGVSEGASTSDGTAVAASSSGVTYVPLSGTASASASRAKEVEVSSAVAAASAASISAPALSSWVLAAVPSSSNRVATRSLSFVLVFCWSDRSLLRVAGRPPISVPAACNSSRAAEVRVSCCATLSFWTSTAAAEKPRVRSCSASAASRADVPAASLACPTLDSTWVTSKAASVLDDLAAISSSVEVLLKLVAFVRPSVSIVLISVLWASTFWDAASISVTTLSAAAKALSEVAWPNSLSALDTNALIESDSSCTPLLTWTRCSTADCWIVSFTAVRFASCVEDMAVMAASSWLRLKTTVLSNSCTAFTRDMTCSDKLFDHSATRVSAVCTRSRTSSTLLVSSPLSAAMSSSTPALKAEAFEPIPFSLEAS